MTSPRDIGDWSAENLTVYEDFPHSSCAHVEEAPPSVGRIAHEMGALQAVQLVVEGHGDPGEARLLCRTYLARLEPESLEERVIAAALRRILCRPMVVPGHGEPRTEPWEACMADTVALAWMSWAAGDCGGALATAKRFTTVQKKHGTGKAGAIHLLTLSFWSEAVTLLSEGDLAGARRFFKRAIELGSQFGTDSHPMVSWAYAASFFPR